eukprot:2918770-Prymnesium_polylepis.1
MTSSARWRSRRSRSRYEKKLGKKERILAELKQQHANALIELRRAEKIKTDLAATVVQAGLTMESMQARNTALIESLEDEKDRMDRMASAIQANQEVEAKLIELSSVTGFLKQRVKKLFKRID